MRGSIIWHEVVLKYLHKQIKNLEHKSASLTQTTRHLKCIFSQVTSRWWYRLTVPKKKERMQHLTVNQLSKTPLPLSLPPLIIVTAFIGSHILKSMWHCDRPNTTWNPCVQPTTPTHCAAKSTSVLKGQLPQKFQPLENAFSAQSDLQCMTPEVATEYSWCWRRNRERSGH